MNLQIKHMEADDQSIVALAGEIDAFTVAELKETFATVMQRQNHVVVVDMEDVTYMDSTGLGVFISALKSAKENNNELKLVHIQDRVYRLFVITGLDKIMDLTAAIRGVNNNGAI